MIKLDFSFPVFSRYVDYFCTVENIIFILKHYFIF